jgi:GT2 family glycosyltransferase
MKQSFPFVSIVIPTYNAQAFIVPALKSVLKTNYPKFEIVVMDDLSSDQTINLIKTNFSKNTRVHLFRNQIKKLAAGTRNAGIKKAKGSLIALLDHDIEVDPNWIHEMLKVMNRYQDCGVVQGKVMDIKNRDIIQHAGVKINAALGWVIPVGFGLKGKTHFTKEIQAFANATGLMFKKDVWQKVNGFDEMLEINTDDWDFNWRTNLYGFKHYFAPQSLTYHWSKTQRTRDAWIKRTNWEFHFAKVPWIFIKNYELANVFKYLPIYIVVNLARGLFNLIFRLNPAPLLGFLYSIGWLLRNFSILLKQRALVQKNRVISDAELLTLFDTSNVLNYFINHWFQAFKAGKKISIEKPYV